MRDPCVFDVDVDVDVDECVQMGFEIVEVDLLQQGGTI